MALDLSGLASVVDTWLVDTVEITSDGGVTDDYLDEGTGLLTPTPPAVVYAGRGAIQPLGAPSPLQDPDVQRIVAETGASYRLLLPLAQPAAISVDNLARVTAQGSTTPHPELLERRFKVVELGQVSSFAVVQIHYLKQIGRARPV